MKFNSFLCATTLQVALTAAQGPISSSDVPPIAGHGVPLSGAALKPEYYGPRRVAVYTEAGLAKLAGGSSRKIKIKGRDVPYGVQYTDINAPSTSVPSALYTMTNIEGGNTILAMPVNPDGTINSTGVLAHSTGGNGKRFPFAGSTQQDALDSQSAMMQLGSRLFVTNAGSNTITEFAINCTNPANMTMIGKPVDTLGDNPSTIAVAAMNQIACVANTGTRSSISCFTYDAGFGHSEINGPQLLTPNGHVNLTLPQPQTTPPLGPPNTVSQLLFSDDESVLIAVVKGASNGNGAPSGGYINAYPMTSQGLGTPVTSPVGYSALLFGCVFEYNTLNLFCADAFVGALRLTQSGDGGQYQINKFKFSSDFGNHTNCWTARSPYANGPNYLDAVDFNYVNSFNKTTADLLGQFSFAGHTYQPNQIEMVAASNLVYGLSFGTPNSGSSIQVVQDTDFNGGINYIQNFYTPYSGYNTSGLTAFIPDDVQNTCDFK